MLRKAIRWCAVTLLVAAAATGVARADDDSLLEKALEPEIKETVVDDTSPEATLPPGGPSQPAPEAPGQLAQPAPDGGAIAPAQPAPAIGGGAAGGAVIENGGAVGGAVETVVATPAPRTMFMPGAGPLGPFGEPLGYGAPRVCIGESLLLKGGPNGAPIGRVVMQVDRLIFDAEIVAWAENGVHVIMPTVLMLGPTEGMIHVIRADGILADTLPIILAPK